MGTGSVTVDLAALLALSVEGAPFPSRVDTTDGDEETSPPEVAVVGSSVGIAPSAVGLCWRLAVGLSMAT